MNKKTIITLLLAFVALTGWAKEKAEVWEQPTTEYGTSYGDGFFNTALDITKVELKETETLVYLTISRRSDYPDFRFLFVSDTYLKADDKRYALISADGMELDQYIQTGKNGKLDVVFHFQPLPQGTKSFDFIEGDGERAFQIKGIKPVEERWKQLFPSYWRDDLTGDWELAFFEDFAIYQCKFWDYELCDVNPKTSEAEIVMRNGNDELKVKVGKNKKGKRTMQIGRKKVVYSMITSRFMPDYPTKDTRTDFVDSGYKTDTITVAGWIKDMPEQFKQQKTFEFAHNSFITGEEQSVHADLDSLGRFIAKIPVQNSSEFFCDWSRCFVRTMLEPGKTYFMLYDFKEGRRYFMGEDCRLQNELFKYPLDWESLRMEKETDFDQYIASADSLIKAQYAYIDELCKEHPTLSTRFQQYRKSNTLWQQARDFGQARFKGEKYQFPDNARKFAYDTFWTKLEKPYTLHRDLREFIDDYLADTTGRLISSIRVSVQDQDMASFASNDEELALLTRWKNWVKEVTAAIEAAPTVEEKQRIANEQNTVNAELIKAAEKILNGPQGRKVIGAQMLIQQMNANCQALDSLNADPFIRDIVLSQLVYEEIDHRRASLHPQVLDTLRAMISNPICLEQVEKQNERYLVLENREFDRLVLKSSDNLAELTEGEALLKKILEPYKGKFVLLDIWGTWCGPCKDALSHSTEEYARLKDYDIEFLYLANNSPQDSWENVIKEYNVSGDNVTHYNLPKEQQDAIERHLKVTSFPTYKLFDREGNLLDIEVDARDLDNLARLLNQLK